MPLTGGRRSFSLRTKLLAGILVPATLLIGAATTVSVVAIADAVQHQDRARVILTAARESFPFYPAVKAERSASLLYVSSRTPQNRAALDASRAELDRQVAALTPTIAELDENLPADLRDLVGSFAGAVQVIGEVRGTVDRGDGTRLQVYERLGVMPSALVANNYRIARAVGSALTAEELGQAAEIYRLGDYADRTGALLAGGMIAGDLTPQEYDEVVSAAFAYRRTAEDLTPRLDPEDAQRLAAALASPEARLLSDGLDRVLALGYPLPPADSDELPDPRALVEAADAVGVDLLGRGLTATIHAAQRDVDAAGEVVRSSITTAAVLLLGLAVAFALAVFATGSVVRRLSRLRRETLALAVEVLPDAVRRLRNGERVDVDTEIPTLEHGDDEIGQVAAAFNQAQRTAVDAAVDEAGTRTGFNAAFLNIARRSQSILRKQMEVLDQVQRAESDPAQLELLFQLDHLATRERRNAENLIILGGDQPRRQWRRPVPLGELVRGAVGEAEDYRRISVEALPAVSVQGPVVGDLVHLLAELVDNATAFSPPGAPITIHGAEVGRGILVEIEDQGLGIEPTRLDELNELLRDPPDFGLFTLSRDSRVGLFVVARLAVRHEVVVTLRPSMYGGIRAGVLFPAAILSADPVPSGELPPDGPAADAAPAPGRDGGPPLVTRNGRAYRGTMASQAPGSSGEVELPSLPRRSRQAHMHAELHEPSEPAPRRDGSGAHDDLFETYEPDPARDRMSALRNGSALGHAADEPRGE